MALYTHHLPQWKRDEVEEIKRRAGEYTLLSLVDGRRTLRELITLGPGDLGSNAKLLYAFWVLRLVTRRETQASGIRRIQWKTPGGMPSAGGDGGDGGGG